MLRPRPSSKAISTSVAGSTDPTLPAILEFQSPSTAILNVPTPPIARRISWLIASMVILCFAATGIIKVDRVVVSGGRVVSRAPTVVVQPLEVSIVRAIDVLAGDSVHAGLVLARLDPTFAAADMGALAAQVSTLQAQVSRMQAEVDNKPFTYSGLDPNLALQAAIFAQRQSEYDFKLENYQQKADSLTAAIAKTRSDAGAYRERLSYARNLEDMRKELEKLNVGSKLNTLAAMDTRAEMQRNLAEADQATNSAVRDLAALIAERNGFVQQWHADLADKLADAISKLSDARESLNKAQLRRQLVELRASVDSTVLTVAKVSVGSVLNAGQEFITLVPTDAPLEVEANIPGNENGFVHVGDDVAIKFDTFPYTQYGMAHGVVRIVSADSFSSQDEQRNPTGAVPTPAASASSGAVWYRSRITLDKIELHDTPANFRLMPGMPVTADILVGKRTVLRYLLGRIVPLTSEAMREP